MKRLLTAVLLTLSWALTWADSPLTSTDFAKNYNDQPMVQLAQKLSNESDTNIPVSISTARPLENNSTSTCRNATK